MTKPVDRRVKRTNEHLRAALMALMARENWEDISVQLICDEADIARSTFYTHFDNKQELLDFSFMELEAHLNEPADDRHFSQNGKLSFLPNLLDHVREHGILFDKLSSNTTGFVILNKFKETINRLTRDEIQTTQSDITDIQISFVCGGISAVIEQWHLEKYETPTSQIVGQIDDLVIKSLK